MDEEELLELPKLASQLKQEAGQLKRYAESLKPELKTLVSDLQSSPMDGVHGLFPSDSTKNRCRRITIKIK